MVVGGWVGVEGIEWEGKEWAIWQCTWVCGWCVGVRVSGCRALFEWEHMWLEVCVGVECVCVERWKVLRARARVCKRWGDCVFPSHLRRKRWRKEKGKEKKNFPFFMLYAHLHTCTHTHTVQAPVKPNAFQSARTHRVWMVGWMRGNSAETWGQKPGGHLRGFNSAEPWESGRKHTHTHAHTVSMHTYIIACLCTLKCE